MIILPFEAAKWRMVFCTNTENSGIRGSVHRTRKQGHLSTVPGSFTPCYYLVPPLAQTPSKAAAPASVAPVSTIRILA